MQPPSSKNSKTLFSRHSKGFNILIRVLIIVAAYGTLYIQISKKQEELILPIGSIPGGEKLFFVLLVLLAMMVLNWSTETWKWQFLIRKIESLSFRRSFSAVLAGITVSMFTPNRIGEYFGRIFVLKENHRWEGVFITIIGSMSQLIVTLFLGTPMFYLFLHKYMPIQDDHVMAIMDISLLGILVFALLLFGLFMNIGFITKWTNRLIRDEWVRLRRYLEVFGYYHRKELIPVLFLSLLRYIIFSVQFFIVIRAFGIHLDVMEALIAIPSIFLITTVFPSFTLAELGLRGSASIFVLGAISMTIGSENDMAMAAAAGILWVINLVIPAISGTFIIARMNFLRRKNGS